MFLSELPDAPPIKEKEIQYFGDRIDLCIDGLDPGTNIFLSTTFV